MGALSIPLMGQAPQLTSPYDLLRNRLTLAQQSLQMQQMQNQQMIQKQIQQENALKLQAAQEDENDQKTFGQALKDNTTIDGQGNVNMDWNKAMAQAMPSMRLRNIQGIQADYQKHQAAALELSREQRQNLLTQNQIQGQEFAGIEQAPDDQRQDMWAQSLQRMRAAGIDTGAYPDEAPANDVLDSYIARTGYTGTILKNADAKALAAQRAANERLKNTQIANQQADEDAKAQQRARETVARQVSGVTDQAGLDAVMGKLPDNVSSEYAGLTTYSPETIKAIQANALTAEQREKAAESAKPKPAKLATNETELLQLANDPTIPQPQRDAYQKTYSQRVADIAKANEDKQGAIDRRQDERQAQADSKTYSNLDTQEHSLWSQAEALQKAADIKIGDPVYDPRNAAKGIAGNVVMDASRKQQLQQAADAAREQATSLYGKKLEILDRHGWGKNTQKVFPAARVAEYAAKNKWTLDQAKQFLTGKGYVIQ